jgi:hypothetical protein
VVGELVELFSLLSFAFVAPLLEAFEVAAKLMAGHFHGLTFGTSGRFGVAHTDKHNFIFAALFLEYFAAIANTH